MGEAEFAHSRTLPLSSLELHSSVNIREDSEITFFQQMAVSIIPYHLNRLEKSACDFIGQKICLRKFAIQTFLNGI